MRMEMRMEMRMDRPGVTVIHDVLVTRGKLLISTTLSVCLAQCQHISATSPSVCLSVCLSFFLSFFLPPGCNII